MLLAASSALKSSPWICILVNVFIAAVNYYGKLLLGSGTILKRRKKEKKKNLDPGQANSKKRRNIKDELIETKSRKLLPKSLWNCFVRLCCMVEKPREVGPAVCEGSGSCSLGMRTISVCGSFCLPEFIRLRHLGHIRLLSQIDHVTLCWTHN